MKPALPPLSGAMTVVACALLLTGVSRAQAPAEIQNVQVNAAGELIWDAETGADVYNVYRAVSGNGGGLASLRCAAFAEMGCPRSINRRKSPGMSVARAISSGPTGKSTPTRTSANPNWATGVATV